MKTSYLVISYSLKFVTIRTATTCTKAVFNPLPDDKILDRSELKQSADASFKFDENFGKFSKRVENCR